MVSDMVGLHKSNSVSSHVASALRTKSVPCPPQIKISLRLSPSDPICTRGRGAGGCHQRSRCSSESSLTSRGPEERVRLLRRGPALKGPCKVTNQDSNLLHLILGTEYLIFPFAPHKDLGCRKGRCYHRPGSKGLEKLPQANELR